jgi:uncharacterized protein YdaU (DUF1376 family)
VEADVDCTNLDGFYLNVERLMSSELLALHGNEIIGAAVLLWCRAWKQRPAASLPDDDRINAAFARLSLKKFREVKDAVTRGFVKCSDGRLYHVFLSKVATDAYRRKAAFQKKRGADAERLRQWRESQRETADVAPGTRDEAQNETHVETRFVADRNGKEGEGEREGYIKRKSSPSESPKERSSKGCRIPPYWRPTADDWKEAYRSLGSQKAEGELAKFRDYWIAKPGKDGVKRDWDATWRNWVRKAAEQLATGPIVAPHAEPTIDLGGEFSKVPIRNLPGIVKLFEDKGAWLYPTPKPGGPGCAIPDEFLPSHLRSDAAGQRSIAKASPS